MPDAPNANVKEIAIVLKDTPTAFCRKTTYKGVQMCFDKNLDVTKWLYDPDTFARVYHADIDKLREKVDDCPVCRRTSQILELRQKNGPQQKIIVDSLVTFAYTMLEDLARQEGVAIPEVRIGTCPSPEARTKTCYIVKEDPLGMADKRDPGRIWIHPEDIGPTAIAHEFYHYFKYQKREDDEARDEMKANEYARMRVNEMFPEPSEEFNSQSSVFNLTGASSMLERLWRPLADQMQGLTAKDVDNAFTPEIIATSIETVTETVMPKFASTLTNVILGGFLLAGCMLKRVPVKWKTTMIEMAGHHLSRAIRLFNPREFSVITSQAYDFGRSVTSFDGASAANQFIRPYDLIAQDMNVASQTINRIMKQVTPQQRIQPQVKQKYSGTIPGLDLGISQA